MKKVQLYLNTKHTAADTGTAHTQSQHGANAVYLEQFLCVSEPTEAAAHLSECMFVSSVWQVK